jgi:ParB-like chromosome segregation protein Spo0J
MESEIVWLQVERLRCGLSPRERELDRIHVAALAELEGRWPPILVSRHDDWVVDGHHRIAAARMLGYSTVAAQLFDGTADDAFIESVRRNVEHGLPLTIDERKGAARRVLVDHPDWSDRRIAEVCGLSPRTVGRLRAAADPGTHVADSRVGLDGRTRVQPESRRLEILETVRTNPRASLRTIAQAVGTSPETVRRVRHTLEQQDPSGRAVASGANCELGTVVALSRPNPLAVGPRHPAAADPALTSTSSGQQFAAWFDAGNPGADWWDYVLAVPLSRVYEIADEARRRANVWDEFAALVEQRTRTRRSV